MVLVFWRRPQQIQLTEQRNNFRKTPFIFFTFEVIVQPLTHTHIYLFSYCTIFLIFYTHNASAAAEMVVTCISSVYTNPACCLPFDGCCTRWSMTGLEIHLFEHSNHMLRRERERGSRELRNTEEESWYTTNWCRFDEVVCLSLALKLCGNKVFLCFLTFCFVSKKKYIVQNTLRYIHYDLTPTKIEGVWVEEERTNCDDTDFCTNRNNKHVLKWWWLHFENIHPRSEPLK